MLKELELSHRNAVLQHIILSLQQVWPCSLFSTVPPPPVKPPKPAVLPYWAVTNPTQKPTDLQRVLICERYWSHHTGYHKWNPRRAERVEKSLWLCRRTLDDRLWGPAVQQCAGFCCRRQWRLWRLRLSLATIKYRTLNIAVTPYVRASVQTQLGDKQELFYHIGPNTRWFFCSIYTITQSLFCRLCASAHSIWNIMMEITVMCQVSALI